MNHFKPEGKMVRFIFHKDHTDKCVKNSLDVEILKPRRLEDYREEEINKRNVKRVEKTGFDHLLCVKNARYGGV